MPSDVVKEKVLEKLDNLEKYCRDREVEEAEISGSPESVVAILQDTVEDDNVTATEYENDDEDQNLISMDEIMKALILMKAGKAVAYYRVQSEMLKSGGSIVEQNAGNQWKRSPRQLRYGVSLNTQSRFCPKKKIPTSPRAPRPRILGMSWLRN
ncbi:hypothetical protein EVAR_45767_1 [Eumeta japonica]|uniref:Uncharacterized protein n=1 Tax=Eumeta variegata TaxID=151549 RepID=A0A4C1YU26_EUMVA|nr:hypothetical protein EVAR_45767_1 [Eumeta japonica]